MAGSSMGHLALLVALAALLSACENSPNPFSKKDNPAEAPITTGAARSVRLVDRDVEAPEVFQTTDTALWDGRPSLGGVWVASPDAVNPERVILRNEANGKFVIGALFRRERDNPGPKLQISSDAAEALGMLAGQPGKLNVVALRREESKADIAKATPVAAAKPETVIGDVEAAPVDPIAAAGAALDSADAGASVAAAAVAAPSDDLDPTPRPGETKRAARQRARAATKAAAAAAAAAPAFDGEAPVAAPVPELDVVPLPDIGAAADTAAPASGPVRIQIGIFSVEANAQLAVDKLKAGGVDATIRKDESKGKAYWSVVASGSGERDALLAKVKGLGFVDAYSVSG